jgi:tetrahydromethanopterin S-methyltransferase subunit C
MKSMMFAAGVLLLAAGQAVAGTTPGPEMGEGFAGLSVLAAVVAGYVAVRRIRRKRV